MCTSTHTLLLHPPPPPMAVEAPGVAASVLSGPESVLTSTNATASRKCSRGEIPQLVSINDPLVEMRSGMPSTSGQSTVLQSLLLHQNAEIDTLIRLQMENLRCGVEEARKRQCRGIAAAVETHVGRVLEAKRLELDALRRRNAELEERVRQIAAEGQMWFNVARNSEALVSGLRSSLEQALLRGGSKEGSGESGDDAQSCCHDGDEGALAGAPVGRTCRACGEGEACVLVLPCRHVCVCEACAARTTACPACGRAKNQCLRIFFS